MSELTGLAWIHAPENRAYERRVLRPLMPFIAAGTVLAKMGVKVIEHNQTPIRSHPRSLIPGEHFIIQKIGNPETGGAFSKLLQKCMLDELPQLNAAWRGDAALVGPRGTLPQHRELLFDMLDDGRKVDDWKNILSKQKHGLLSTYALNSHNQPEATDDYLSRGSAELANEALVRYESDKKDFVDASLGHSQLLVRGFVEMVKQKLALK